MHEAGMQRGAETRDGHRILAEVESLILVIPEVLLQVCPSHKLTAYPLLHIQYISLVLELVWVTFLSLAAKRSKTKWKPWHQSHLLWKVLHDAPDTAGLFPDVLPSHLAHANPNKKWCSQAITAASIIFYQGHGEKITGFRAMLIWVLTLLVLLINCMTLERSLNVSGSHFPHLNMGILILSLKGKNSIK